MAINHSLLNFTRHISYQMKSGTVWNNVCFILVSIQVKEGVQIKDGKWLHKLFSQIRAEWHVNFKRALRTHTIINMGVWGGYGKMKLGTFLLKKNQNKKINILTEIVLESWWLKSGNWTYHFSLNITRGYHSKGSRSLFQERILQGHQE